MSSPFVISVNIAGSMLIGTGRGSGTGVPEAMSEVIICGSATTGTGGGSGGLFCSWATGS